jgi:uncharacterized sporulation protein YeaH/YhbH (DUF444 family)
MKKIFILIPLLLLVTGFLQAQQTPSVQLAQRIAQKMKDTLTLTNPQRNQIFQINMQLHDRKQEVRQQTTNQDTLRIKFQRIERKRDSLYHTIMSDSKYQLYLQKKRNLVNNN